MARFGKVHNQALTYRYRYRCKKRSFLHSLRGRSITFIVIPAQKSKDEPICCRFNFVAGIDSSHFLWLVVLVTSTQQKLFQCSFYFSKDQHNFCILLQEDYSCKSYCEARHTGEVEYSAFCQGDQTIRRGKMFLSNFCTLSRMNKDSLLRHERSPS